MDFYSEHIRCGLGKGKHEIYFIAKLRSMEGKVILKKKVSGTAPWDAGFTSAENTLIFPPGRISELAGS